MKYRILEKSDFSGEQIFIPQYRKMFMWMNFMEFEVFPKQIKFHSLESSIKFIQKQIKSPKEKVVYTTEG